MLGFWSQVADEFEAQHPHITIEISSHSRAITHPRPSESALAGPDRFPASGAELVELVLAGSVMDITDQAGGAAASAGGSAAGWIVGGRLYGLPYSTGIEGFWYRRSLFERAGISGTPTTMADLTSAAAKLREAGIVPIIAHTESHWPAARYWQHLALARCGAGIVAQAMVDLRFDEHCFVAAGADLAALLSTDPFQPGWASPPQVGQDATALLVRAEAAMELRDDSYQNDLRRLARDLGEDADAVLADLGWFAFPSVPGGIGGPGTVLGGGKGFACSAQAPPECAELLRYLVSAPVQERYAALGVGLPAINVGATVLPDTYPAGLLETLYHADHVQVWLDVAYGTEVTTAMTTAVMSLIGGHGTGQDVASAMDAAGRQVR